MAFNLIGKVHSWVHACMYFFL